MPRRRLRLPKPLKTEVQSDDYKAIFAHNFRVARVKAGMRQEDIATAVGVTSTYVTRVESGSENLTIDQMKRLSDAVKQSLLDLLRRDFNQAGDDTSAK
jgi:transcriptional regulator with XRE-family HTH domain